MTAYHLTLSFGKRTTTQKKVFILRITRGGGSETRRIPKTQKLQISKKYNFKVAWPLPELRLI